MQEGLPISLVVLFLGVILGAIAFVGLVTALVFLA